MDADVKLLLELTDALRYFLYRTDRNPFEEPDHIERWHNYCRGIGYILNKDVTWYYNLRDTTA